MWSFRRWWLSVGWCACAVACVALAGCSKPEVARGVDVVAEDEYVSIAYLKSLYSGHPVAIRDGYFIRGSVASTDRYGNYDRTLAVCDDTGGVEIRVDSRTLFEEFRVGDVVDVCCNSLTLGAYGGLVQLGTPGYGGYEVGFIEGVALASHVVRSGAVAPEPRMYDVALDALSVRYLSCPIRISGVQFADWSGGMAWCDEGMDTNRVIVDRQGRELIVRTSRYAEFADWTLPSGSGSIEGILSWFGDSFQLRVVDPRRAVMAGERF